MAHHGRPSRYNDPPRALEINELRELWRRNRWHADAKILLLEIKRLHDVIVSIENSRESIEKACREAGIGGLVALHQVKRVVTVEPAVLQTKRRHRDSA